MTDKQIDAIEEAAKSATSGEWKNHLGIIYSTNEKEICVCRGINGFANADFIIRTNPVAILELIAELRRVRRERDWICQEIEDTNNRIEISYDLCCPNEKRDCPDNTRCHKCWLEAAKEATSCQK